MALLLAVATWGSWLIARTSFVLEGKRWFTLFDDPMISMTYVRNWVEGHGLTWTRGGERVEGFTDPLWLLAMLPGELLPIEPRFRSLGVQALSLLTLIATVAAVRSLLRAHFPSPLRRHWMPAAVATAFYYPLAYWTVMGWETGLQALLTVLCVGLALDAVHRGRDRHLGLWLACTAAYLLRMDMAILVVAAHSYLLAMGGLRRRGARSWLLGLGFFLVAAGGYELFRWVYFRDLLPNTYYLKLAGIPLEVRLLRGLDCLWTFIRAHGALLLPIGVALAPTLRRDRRLLLPLGIVVAQAAYVVWVGGDAWEGAWSGAIPVRADRFLAFVMPLVFVIGNVELEAALAAWRARPAADRWRGRARSSYAVMAVATVLGLVLANGWWQPVGARRAGAQQMRLALGLERPPLATRHAAVLGKLLRFERLVDREAVVATAWAGIPAYFSRYRMVDLLGYNDRALAHGPSSVRLDASNFDRFVPGHVKWDVRRALVDIRPDAFFQVWEVRGLGQPWRVMQEHGYERRGGFWVRGDSQWVNREIPLDPHQHRRQR